MSEHKHPTRPPGKASPGQLPAITSPRPTHRPASLSFWQDGYARILFLCIFGMLALNIQGLGIVRQVLFHCRWGFLGLAALAGIKYFLESRRAPMTPEHRCLVVLLIISLASCTYSVLPWYSFQRLGSFVLLWIALFVGAWSWLQTRRNVLLGFHLIYTIICVLTLLSLFHLADEGILNRSTRAEGAFGRATGSGGFACAAIPLVLWRLRYSHGRARLLATILLGTLAYLLVFSGARAAILTASVSVPLVLWKLYRPSRPVLVLGVVVTVTAVLGGSVGLDMLPDYIVREKSLSGFTGRSGRWELGLHFFATHPILGHGFGVARYLPCMDERAIEIIEQEQNNAKMAAGLRAALAKGQLVAVTLHSEQIERVVETGVLGGLCFALFWGFLLRRGLQSLSGPNDAGTHLALVLYASCWATFVNTFMHSSLFAVGGGSPLGTWFKIVLAIAAGSHAAASARRLSRGTRQTIPTRGPDYDGRIQPASQPAPVPANESPPRHP